VGEAPLLRVEDLVVVFETDEGPLRAVDGVSFEVGAGRTLGLVGESGCGKSVTALSILRLLPEAGRIASGRIFFEGRDLLALPEREMRAIRGGRISMIFQEPMSALNPVYTVGFQIEETLRAHLGLRGAEARARAIELLEKVGISAARDRVDAYPHQLSGGMRQRVMIAIALACGPRLLVADEPTTALDVTIQAQILEQLDEFRRELGMSVILITHDLGVVAQIADEVAVMYAGKIVERAPVREIFARPRHPYTEGLLRSVPGFGDNVRRSRLPTIPGVVPDLRALPSGCRFRERCERAFDACGGRDPALEPVAEDGAHLVACLRAREDRAPAPGAEAACG
jgi:peptide/nickel transport system ATP-binding protein